MDRFDDDTLFAELRALRPTPRPEFAAELDERVAAGFPRRSTASGAAMPFALLADRWRALTPRRRLIPVLGMAFAVLAVATVVVGVSQSNFGSPKVSDEAMTSATSMEGGGGGGEAESAEALIAPATPHHADTPKQVSPVEKSAEESEAVEAPPAVEGGFTGNFFGDGAPAVTHRDIERSAYVTLGTKPGEVSSAAAKVYEAVHAANGVVLHSKVQSGSAGATGAYFELLIPSRKLDDTLAAFSQIAEVRERHDATNDITAPTVGAAEELRDSNASIEGLLKELGDTETETERESVEARLREERRHHAAIRARLDQLDKRASMSEVTVRIVTDHGAGVTPPSKGDGSWGVGDALHDAGHILTIAAGVALIGLAVLGPIALILLAFWLANRFRVRRLRERTLG
ncbi:MAG: DUF4349 domain-containing protein [Solirubrobacterales bacterium]